MNTRHLLAILAFCCLATACGGGAGGGSNSGAGAGVPPTSDGPGQRSVPGFTIAAERRSALTAGAPCIVRVTIKPDSGQAIAGVQVWLGLNEYAEPASTTPATAVTGLANTWDVTTTLPSPLPAEATIWLRLTTADGSIIEVGRDAFQLATLPEG
jgi:hypothetical protein